MIDTARLERLTSLVERSGAKLVAIGDSRQLPSIGAGGMFDHITKHAPTASSSKSTAPKTANEQIAWGDLRDGRPEHAMAYYHSEGQLYLRDTRDQAGEAAVAALGRTHPDATTSPGSRSSPTPQTTNSTASTPAPNTTARTRRTRRPRTRTPSVPTAPAGRPCRVHRPTPPHRRATRRERQPRPPSPTITDHGPRRSSSTAPPVASPSTGRTTEKLRLNYARHIYREQGATLDPHIVITGGWQTSQEPPTSKHPAPATAPNGSSPATNSATKDKTPTASTASPNTCDAAAPTPSLAHPELPDRDYGPRFHHTIAPSRTSRIPGIARAINRIVQPSRTQERT